MIRTSDSALVRTADHFQMLTALESAIEALYDLMHAIRVTVARLESQTLIYRPFPATDW
jgi:hypothetical protein